MKLSPRILRIAGVVLGLGILIGNAGFWKLVRLSRDVWHLEKTSVRLRAENARLEREAYYLEHDSEYIERVARRDMNLVGEGEVEYRFKSARQE